MKSSTDKIAYNHPAQFPEQLVADHIYTWSNEGDFVYDPFGGSGTVAAVARDLGRSSILIELNPAYIEIMKKRLRLYEQLPGIDEISVEVHA